LSLSGYLHDLHSFPTRRSSDLTEKVISASFSSSLIRKITINKEIRQKSGIEKKGKNQINAVKAAPKIGLNTFPTVLLVSIIPKVALASSSRRNISPTKGRTIGIAPEEIGRASCRERVYIYEIET